MGATSVGEIGLDLVVNQNQFNKQMSGIQGMAKKVGAALAAAFAVKKIVDFGKECTRLGSDLQEVQNIVDVAFPHMTAQIDKFAKSAATNFGLSEAMAKRYSAMFGTMATQFGFSESAAYDMGTTLAGLAGDVASFYDMTQDEAYTKLKAVFSGETEVLKDIGVVMTQNALDAYAMANGFGKTTQAMSEAEKVALRYQFVQQQLSLAQGDFIRTSDGWANQVRILKLQFDSLKASIGQGLINLFTPVLKAINTVLGHLTTLANAFKSFTELITGKKSSGQGNAASPVSDLASSAEDAGAGLSGASDAAKGLGDNASGVGKAAKKAAKEMRALMGFDKVNKLSDNSVDDGGDSGSGGSGGGAGSGGAGGVGSTVDYGNLAQGDTVIDKLGGKFKGLIDRVKELAGLFKKGFIIGFGDSEKRIDSIKGHIKSIGDSLKDIFTDKAVVSSANRLFDAIALNAGKAAGSMASIGVTIADNLIGGFDNYLQKSSGYIKERLVKIFDANTRILDLFGELCEDIADIFSVFANDDGKSITASIIGIFADSVLGIREMVDRDMANILSVIAGVISENKDKIKAALENTLAPVAKIADSIHGFITNTFSKISEVYDTYIDPAFVKIKDGFSTVFGAALDAYNNYLAPVLDWIAERFTVLVSEYVQPLMDAFLDLWGKAVDAIATFWEFISPFVAWFVEAFIMQFANKLQELWVKFEFVFSAIASVVQGVIEVFSGVIDFIVGVFTGNWDRAWTGIKEIFQGICTAIQGVFTAVKDLIVNVFTVIETSISNKLSVARDKVKTILEAISTVFTNILNTIKDAVGNIFETGIKQTILNVMDAVSSGISSVLGGIRDTFSNVFNAVRDTVSGVFNGIWDTIRSVVNSILGGIETMVNGVISGVNSIARAFNSMRIDIPDWVPGIGGGSLGFNLPTWSGISLPRLAQGGYVKPNTPQLAMIGDNRHQGEVVAPENKLQEMAEEAARAVSGSGISKAELEQIINNAVMRIIAALSQLGFYIDGELLAKALQKVQDNMDVRFNAVEII